MCVLQQVDKCEGWLLAQRSVGRSMQSKLNPAGTASSMESAPTYTRYRQQRDSRGASCQTDVSHCSPMRNILGLISDCFLQGKWAMSIVIGGWFPTGGFKIVFLSKQFYEECTASIWERDEDFQIQRSPSRWSSILWKVKRILSSLFISWNSFFFFLLLP